MKNKQSSWIRYNLQSVECWGFEEINLRVALFFFTIVSTTHDVFFIQQMQYKIKHSRRKYLYS